MSDLKRYLYGMKYFLFQQQLFHVVFKTFLNMEDHQGMLLKSSALLES